MTAKNTVELDSNTALREWLLVILYDNKITMTTTLYLVFLCQIHHILTSTEQWRIWQSQLAGNYHTSP